MPAISIGDAELWYEEQGDGPPLLLVSGLNGVGSWWAHQVRAFSGFRVITHDHRGTGRSTWSEITYSVDQMAADLLRLMDALHIDSAHVTHADELVTGEGPQKSFSRGKLVKVVDYRIL